ncbi:MAG: sigma factor [Waltera sp.]
MRILPDAMQETILTCWEKIDTLQKNRYFKTWMIRILINKCKDILRLRETDDLCGRTAGTGSEGYSGGRGKFGMEGSPVGTG